MNFGKVAYTKPGPKPTITARERYRRERCYRKFHAAVRSGELKLANECFFCASEFRTGENRTSDGAKRLHSHHDNYLYPLHVLRVCALHHKHIHCYEAKGDSFSYQLLRLKFSVARFRGTWSTLLKSELKADIKRQQALLKKIVFFRMNKAS